MTDEEIFVSICQALLAEGKTKESKIEKRAHKIMDNPQRYPSFFEGYSQEFYSWIMKQYHIYIFSQDGCPPCDRLKQHIETLTYDEQLELDVVPMKTADGQRTQLAEEFNIEATPTLIVAHEDQDCQFDKETGYEYCDLIESDVERLVGAKAIIEHLDATLDAYTYVHGEWAYLTQ